MTTRLTRRTVTGEATIEAVLSRLATSDLVDGLALYGSRTGSVPGADYDVLVLVTDRPRGMVQLFTSVDQLPADVLFVDVTTYDQVLDGSRRLTTSTVDAVFMRKIRQADIVVDRSRRLERGREAARRDADWFRVPSYSGRYLLWFSQNFGLAHMKRMARSTDPIYLTAVDVMLASAVSVTCRAYFDLRQLPWEGEKAAIRHLEACDPDYLRLLRECLAAVDRTGRLVRYELLVARTLAPFGEIWTSDVAAAGFATPVQDPEQVNAALDFWEQLFR